MRLATSTLCALALCAGCAGVSSRAWTPGAPRPASPVPARVAFLSEPAEASLVGVVEAHDARPGVTLPELVAELGTRGASIGADLVRVDEFATRYEMTTETYTYDCRVQGTAGAPCTCGTAPVTTTESRTEVRTDPDGTTHVETVTVTVTKDEPTSCTATRDVEVAVLSLVGRAFSTKGPTR